MTMGRPPKPKKIKILEGNRRKVAKAKINHDPQGIGQPREPVHLNPEEQRLWWEIVTSLPVGLLSRADETMLERMAVAWCRFRQVHATIEKTGLLVQSPMGPIRNPLLVVEKAAAVEMHSCGSELGLSPVARARLSAPDTVNSDPMALLLGPDEDPNGAWSTLPKTKQ
jgi:P27 family predicted phage terminase small subunit